MSCNGNALRVLSPVDLHRVAPGAVAVFGGRVQCAGDLELLLGDAWAMLRVRLAPGQAQLRAGELVVLRGRLHGDSLADAIVLERCVSWSEDENACDELRRLQQMHIGHRLAERARLTSALRSWFAAQEFIEVDTPQRVPSPGLDTHLRAFSSGNAFLITSPEFQMKRLLCGGMPRIYQLVHCFRAEEAGPWHNSEFLMLEWYRAFAGMDDAICDTEQIVLHLAKALLGCPFVDREGVRMDLTPPYERLTVCDAFDRYAGWAPEQTLRWSSEDPERYFRAMVDEVEPAIARLGRPIFLVGFPASQASLAKLRDDDPRVCERFELYLGGVEVCNGFGELTNPVEQRQRFALDQAARARAGMEVYPMDERFLTALAQGMPRSCGNALGVDRLLALLVGAHDVASVQAFPDGWL